MRAVGFKNDQYKLRVKSRPAALAPPSPGGGALHMASNSSMRCLVLPWRI